MPLSNIFSASTSNALYKPKIVMENNSATQPQKITAASKKDGLASGYYCSEFENVEI